MAKKSEEEERDECNLTAHNISFPILCSTFSVILSQLKNHLTLMHPDLEIKPQSGRWLVGLNVPFYLFFFKHQQSPRSHTSLMSL